MKQGQRWEKEYSKLPTRCTACGHNYVPAETASQEEDEYDPPELENQLSPTEYEHLCQAWLKEHENDPDPIEQMMQAARNELAERTNSKVPPQENPDQRNASLLRRLIARLRRR